MGASRYAEVHRLGQERVAGGADEPVGAEQEGRELRISVLVDDEIA
jgi:hypothetical protein